MAPSAPWSSCADIQELRVCPEEDGVEMEVGMKVDDPPGWVRRGKHQESLSALFTGHIGEGPES